MPHVNLTPRQERFCIEIVKGASASDAYRAAGYSCPNPKAVHEASSRLMKNDKVSARIAELRGPVLAVAQMTLHGHQETMAELRDEARRAGYYAAAVTAEYHRGRSAGFYERKEPVDVNLSLSAGPRVIVIGGGAEEGLDDVMKRIEALESGIQDAIV